MVQLPRAPRSSGNIRPSCSTRSWSFCSGVPACAMATPPEHIDLFDAVHALHRQHDFVRIRQRGAHQPGHAALRRDRDAFAVAEPQQQRRHLPSFSGGRPRAVSVPGCRRCRDDSARRCRRPTAPRPCRARWRSSSMMSLDMPRLFLYEKFGRSFTCGAAGKKPGQRRSVVLGGRRVLKMRSRRCCIVTGVAAGSWRRPDFRARHRG